MQSKGKGANGTVDTTSNCQCKQTCKQLERERTAGGGERKGGGGGERVGAEAGGSRCVWSSSSGCALIRYCCHCHNILRRQLQLQLFVSVSVSVSAAVSALVSASVFQLFAVLLAPVWPGTCCHQSATTICHLPLNVHRQEHQTIPDACNPFAYLFAASSQQP